MSIPYQTPEAQFQVSLNTLREVMQKWDDLEAGSLAQAVQVLNHRRALGAIQDTADRIVRLAAEAEGHETTTGTRCNAYYGPWEAWCRCGRLQAKGLKSQKQARKAADQHKLASMGVRE